MAARKGPDTVVCLSVPNSQLFKKQGQIHSNPVADGWAGAVMRKPLGIQKCDLLSYGPTRQGVELRVRD